MCCFLFVGAGKLLFHFYMLVMVRWSQKGTTLHHTLVSKILSFYWDAVMCLIMYFAVYVRIIRTGKNSTVLNPCLALRVVTTPPPPPLFRRFVAIWLLKSVCVRYFFLIWYFIIDYWIPDFSEKRNGLILKGQNVQEEWIWGLETWMWIPSDSMSHPRRTDISSDPLRNTKIWRLY